MTQFSLLPEFAAFVKERHSIYLRRASGKPKPWTADHILQQYRFCNIYRELDTVTQWLRTNWRDPHADDPDLWFAMIVARLINWPESLAEGGYPVPWRPGPWVAALDARKARGRKVFTGAYMIRGNESPSPDGSKAAFLARRAFTPLWDDRKGGRAVFRSGGTLAAAHAWLKTHYCLGGDFLSAQVVADVKYTPLLRSAPDWDTWAAPGPGSQRGLNRVLGQAVDVPWKADEWLAHVQVLRAQLNARIPKTWGRLHAQDVQNCLCEFDKYQRTKTGEGRPRSKYPGGA